MAMDSNNNGSQGQWIAMRVTATRTSRDYKKLWIIISSKIQNHFSGMAGIKMNKQTRKAVPQRQSATITIIKAMDDDMHR